MYMKHVIILIIYELFKTTEGSCSEEYYKKCLNIAEPLIKQADHVFPDNRQDIEIVCKEWNRLILCLSQYSENCFTNLEKTEFHRAISSAIDSVHSMCTDSNYQQEFISHAVCIKPLIMESMYCGVHYDKLVNYVSLTDNMISYDSLCCTYWQFKSCLSQKTDRICRMLNDNENVTLFVTNMIDKALNFLQDQCWNLTNMLNCDFESTTTETQNEEILIGSSTSNTNYETITTMSRETYGRQLWQQTTDRLEKVDRAEGETFGRQLWYQTEHDDNHTQTKWASMSSEEMSTAISEKWYPLLKKDDEPQLMHQNDINNQELKLFQDEHEDFRETKPNNGATLKNLHFCVTLTIVFKIFTKY